MEKIKETIFMKECKKKECNGVILIMSYIFFAIVVSFKFVEPYFGFIDNRNTFFIVFISLISLIKVLFGDFDYRAKRISFVMFFLSYFCLFLGDMSIAYATFSGILLYKTNINKSLKYGFISSFIFFCLICFLGLVFGFNAEYGYAIENNGFRHTLGFTHVNQASSYLSIIICLYVLWRRKINIFDLLFLFLLSYFVYYFTKSRTSFYSFLIIFLFYFLYKLFFNKFNNHHLVYLIYVVSVLISFSLATFLNVQFMNDFLSYRPYLFNLYLSSGNVAWFKADLSVFPENWWCDNLYFSQIYRQSILIFIFSSLFVYFGIKYSRSALIKIDYVNLIICFSFFMIMAITGDFISLTFNPVYAVFFYSILNCKNNININSKIISLISE